MLDHEWQIRRRQSGEKAPSEEYLFLPVIIIIATQCVNRVIAGVWPHPLLVSMDTLIPHATHELVNPLWR